MRLVLLALGGLLLGLVVGGTAGWFGHDQSSTVSSLRSQLNNSLSHQRQTAQRLAAADNTVTQKTAALKAAQAKAAPLELCPTLIYGADGSVGPVSCTIPNPATLAWAQKISPTLFKLGPNATPQQVTVAVKPGVTLPIMCELYQLGQLINHWQFGVQIVQYCNPIQPPQN